ncbi:MAG: pantetheine-phosphate adenylyltransferase [Ruminococcaceae bacterium]|nr:pantetheine-phosphate adenylyltransferase [Oscillospiraceae bacterium]
MIALIPGSFDPITLGHVNVIERAAQKFDRVIVAVMNNDSSKHDKTLCSKTYMFDMGARLELVRLSTEHIENADVISSSGMLIDLFDELGADVIVKGVRTVADLEYEMIHAKWNKAHNDRVETLFLPADDAMASVSSTLVREHLKNGEYQKLDGILSAKAIEYLKRVNIS